MESNGIHELSAAYALHALDEHEERQYEEHLRRCERCRSELVSLQETVSALAYAADPAEPSTALRGRILRQVRTEAREPQAAPRRWPWALRLSLGAAAVAACLALGLGLWASSLSRSLDRERAARADAAAAIAIVADPAADESPISGAQGRLVRSSGGSAALVVSNLTPAPDGRTYEVWVAERGRMQPAGLFRAEDGRALVRLTRPVPAGTLVAVTLEKAGGVDAPTEKPRFTAET